MQQKAKFVDYWTTENLLRSLAKLSLSPRCLSGPSENSFFKPLLKLAGLTIMQLPNLVPMCPALSAEVSGLKICWCKACKCGGTEISQPEYLQTNIPLQNSQFVSAFNTNSLKRCCDFICFGPQKRLHAILEESGNVSLGKCDCCDFAPHYLQGLAFSLSLWECHETTVSEKDTPVLLFFEHTLSLYCGLNDPFSSLPLQCVWPSHSHRVIYTFARWNRWTSPDAATHAAVHCHAICTHTIVRTAKIGSI